MPGTIGYNVIGATGPINCINRCEAHDTAPHHYLAVAGDQVNAFFWYGDDGGTPTSVEMGIFTYVGASPGVQVGVATINITGGPAWHTVAVAINLTAGITYCCAYVPNGGTLPRRVYDGLAGGHNTDATVGLLPPFWTSSGTPNIVQSMYANVIIPGAASPTGAIPDGRIHGL